MVLLYATLIQSTHTQRKEEVEEKTSINIKTIKIICMFSLYVHRVMNMAFYQH